MSDEEFLRRWSQRKRGVAAQEEDAAQGPADPPAEEKTDEEVLAEFGLKDPDEMEPGDDFSGFMRAAVPARLRNRALRRLWVGNPALANLDGLLDYGEDYTDSGVAVEVLQTVYQVGKGMIREAAEAGEPVAEAEPVAQAPEPEVRDAPEPEVRDAPEPEVRDAPEPEPVATADTVPDLPETQAPAEPDAPPDPAPRRMVFTFPEA